MVKEITLPEVSENIDKGEVVKVLVKEGDEIEVDQPVIELETDKAMFEVPSTDAGVVKEIKVKEGDSVNIGGVILTIETDGKADKGKKKEAKPEKETKTKKDTGKKEEKKKDKEEEEKEEKEEEPSAEKKEKKESKEEVKKEKKEKEPGELKQEEKEEEPKKKEEKTQPEKERKISAPASPSVRRLARELGADIHEISGSGPSGRISEEDVKKYVKSIMEGTEYSAGEAVKQRKLPDFSKWGETEVEKMSKVRQITADSMTYSWTTIPHVTHFDKADITSMEEFRKKNEKKFEKEGVKLTITSILVKICAAALKQFPQFNSSIDLTNKEIIYKKYYNIGIAVDTDRGLLVPVIKDADKKNLVEIAKDLGELSQKARNKKITPEEMEGGNFTITNLGGIGGSNFTPIVYAPQVAILAVSRAEMQKVYKEGGFTSRLIAPLALSYDHRIIDGADAARFLRWICEMLEYPLMEI